MAPEWKKAANNLKGKVKLGHVDCDAEKVILPYSDKMDMNLSAWNTEVMGTIYLRSECTY